MRGSFGLTFLNRANERASNITALSLSLSFFLNKNVICNVMYCVTLRNNPFLFMGGF